jgi:hypothetical protein
MPQWKGKPMMLSSTPNPTPPSAPISLTIKILARDEIEGI